ncbi:hypothetical protein KJ865_10140 [Myxococcota bacterium]|nr:hypothetical protein [Myxococcota bacterium]
MSNHRKGAIALYILSIALLSYSLFSREWRLRFAYHKDQKGAEYEQSERYSPKGMETFYGCKKGCQEEDKFRKAKKFRSWEKLRSLAAEGLKARRSAGREVGTLLNFHDKAKKTKTAGIIILVMGWLAVVAGLALLILAFIKRQFHPFLFLGVAGGAGSLLFILVFYMSGTLRDASQAFYMHATYNPHQVVARVSLGFFAALAGSVLLALGGVLQFLDKGDPFAAFTLPSDDDELPTESSAEPPQKEE